MKDENEIIPAEIFKALVKSAVDHGLQQVIADRFQIAPSTVERWSRPGPSLPMPRLRILVRNFIEKQTKREIT